MKAPSPLLGFNNNVRHKGRVFHIQTEDSGVKHPHVITHLFADGGRIVKSTKTSYAEYLGDEEMARKVRALMQEQHKAMFIALRAGKFDHLMEGIPLAEPPPGAPRAPLESTVSIEVEGDKIPGATPSQSGAQAPASKEAVKEAPKAASAEAPAPAPTASVSRPSVPPASAPASAPAASAPAASAPAASAPAASAPAASAPAASAPAASAPAASPPAASAPTGSGRAPMAALLDTAESHPVPEAAPSAPARSPSIPPPSGRNPMPSQGLRHLTPPPKAPSIPPPSGLRPPQPVQPGRASIPPPVQARPSVPPPLSTGPSGPATIQNPLSRAPEKRPPTPAPPTPAREALAARSDPRAEPDAPPSPSSGRAPIGGARPNASAMPPPPGSKPRHDPRAEEPAPVRRSGSLLATLGSGVPNPPKPLSLGASPTPARAANPAPTTLTASLSAGLKPRGDAVRELGTAPTQAMPAARAPSKTGSGPAPGGNTPSRPPMSSSLDLDLEALERAAEQGHSPVYRQVRDLPPPPAAVMRSTGANPATYRSLTPPGAQQSPPSIPAGAAGPSSQQGRYAPSRPASIFGNARPQEGSSIFGEDLISEKSLDEVILSYLAEDLDAPPKK